MLSIASYDQTYVGRCRGKIEASLEAFRALKQETGGARVLAAFETEYCNGLVMALDHYFDHRARGPEGKDGNPLNEIRILCNSFMHNNGKLQADTQIKLDPAKSVLGLRVGDPIVLDEATFAKLADAVFAEIGKRYP
jgi:hypothetical protein